MAGSFEADEEPPPRDGRPPLARPGREDARGAANLRAQILDFRGFGSSRILTSRGGILMSIGLSCLALGRGDDTVGNPHRAKKKRARNQVFRACPLIEARQKQLRVERFEASRAIRGRSISVSSTLPPLQDARGKPFDSLLGNRGCGLLQ